jgi:hypothetical protein
MIKTMQDYNKERSHISIFNTTKERFDKYTRILNKTQDEMLNDLMDKYTELKRIEVLNRVK